MGATRFCSYAAGSPMPFGLPPTSTPTQFQARQVYARSPMPFGLPPTSTTAWRTTSPRSSRRQCLSAFRPLQPSNMFSGPISSAGSPMPFGLPPTSTLTSTTCWPGTSSRQCLSAFRPLQRSRGVRTGRRTGRRQCLSAFRPLQRRDPLRRLHGQHVANAFRPPAHFNGG